MVRDGAEARKPVVALGGKLREGPLRERFRSLVDCDRPDSIRLPQLPFTRSTGAAPRTDGERLDLARASRRSLTGSAAADQCEIAPRSRSASSGSRTTSSHIPQDGVSNRRRAREIHESLREPGLRVKAAPQAVKQLAAPWRSASRAACRWPDQLSTSSRSRSSAVWCSPVGASRSRARHLRAPNLVLGLVVFSLTFRARRASPFPPRA